MTVTGIAALIAVMIAFFQWRTQHHRVLLDLFEKRFNAYNNMRKVAWHYHRWGEITPDQSKFLFGEEVNMYLRKSYDFIVARFNDQYPQGHHLPPSKLPTGDHRVEEFFDKTDELVRPYMKLDFKNLAFWFHYTFSRRS